MLDADNLLFPLPFINLAVNVEWIPLHCKLDPQ